MTNPVDLNIERYGDLFKHLTGVECRLELCDQFGSVFGGEKLEEVNPNNEIDLKELCYKSRIMSSNSNEIILSCPLVLGGDEDVFWLKVIVLQSHEKISDEVEEKVKLILIDVAYCLADDFSNQIAMAGMSKELATRYEEINMVYGLDEVWRNSHKLQEMEAFDYLLKMSLDYLSIDMVILILPGEELCLYHSVEEDLPEVDETIERLKSNKSLLFDAIHESLVINRDPYSESTECEPTIPYKLIISSVINIDSSVAGVVVFANRLNQLHYTNTDRRLCELLAREITKIYQSKRDFVTGLLNRKSFETKLEQVINDNDSCHSLIYFDIDRFQIINDTWGHSEGDRLLKQVASLIRSKLGKKITMSRLGGDEFGILLEDTSGDVAEGIAEGLRRGIEEIYFVSHGQVFDVSCSFGIAEIDPDMGDVIDALSAADVACHLVKETGKNAVRIYQPSDKEMVEHHDQMYWASRIKNSLGENLFEIFGQAITPLSDPHAVPSHYEILLRLRNESGEMIAPARFIPAAERYNLMPQVDRWVLNESLRLLGEADKTGAAGNVSLSINISGQSLCDHDFLKYVTETIIRSEIDPARICLEITETSAVRNLDNALKFMQTLGNVGCLFALDDFGSGMSSFGYLKHLPVNYVKIDGIFITNIINDPVDRVMVKSIHYVAQAMGLKTIAEYVENEEIIDVVAGLGVNYGQGYGIDKPGPILEKLIRTQQVAMV